MAYSKGTPKTLTEAIDNGFEEIEDQLQSEPDSKLMGNNIQDYLAQKFSAAFMRSQSPEESERLKTLWSKIINKE